MGRCAVSCDPPPVSRLDESKLLEFAQRLQGAAGVAQLLQITGDEIRDSIGYQSSWIAVFDLDARVCRILAAAGAEDRDIWAEA